LAATNDKAAFMDVRVESLENETAANVRPKAASFKPAEKGFQNIYTDSGVLMVSLEDVKPYANGFKATFHFGNPQSIDFDNVELDLSWGPARPADGFKTINILDCRKQFQKNKQKVGKRLRGGSWNPVDIIIAPATAEQVGTIEIGTISIPTVFMRVQ
jgi:hypothetical protein